MQQVCGRSGEGNKTDIGRVTVPMWGGRISVDQVYGRSGEGNKADMRRVTEPIWGVSVQQVCGRSEEEGNKAEWGGLQYRHYEGMEGKSAAGSGRIEEGNSVDMRRVTDYQWGKYFGELSGTTL